MKFKAYKFRSSEDKEGEVTLVLKISKVEAPKVRDIPVEEVLDITVERENDETA